MIIKPYQAESLYWLEEFFKKCKDIGPKNGIVPFLVELQAIAF